VTIRILVVDDQPVVRAGVAMMIGTQPDLEVVGEAPDGLAAVSKAAELRPDVVVMDVRMPRLNGIEATRRVAALTPKPPRVVLLTTFDLDEYVFDGLLAGASGFLLKHAPPEEILLAVRAAAAGDALVSPGPMRRLVEHFVRGRPRTKCSTSRRIGPGETRASPAAAARTASKISSGGACFSRNPLAPASRPSKTYSSRSKVVSSTTRGGFGVSAATRRVASIPLSRGMRTSITTTSGLSSAALLTAASPSGASPATSRSGCVPIIMATPARTTGWSSTTRTRMVTADPAGTPAL
jgi:DNA-binding NarL/FixJ family response regulator